MNSKATALAALFLLAACARGGSLPELQSAEPGPYRLDTNDSVRVIVFGQEELSGDFLVNDSGSISVPLIGAVDARGLTTSELEDGVELILADGLLVNPSVSVEVLEFRPIFVLGEVEAPGRYPYEPGMTVLTAVSVAGGFTFRAEEDYVSVTRRVSPTEAVEARAAREALVDPGDVIYVFERFF